jgi:hypothetical protein
MPRAGGGLDGEQRPRAVTRGRYVVAREPLLRRTGQERLAGHGSTCRRGTGRRSLAPDTGQVSEYRTRHRSARRPERDQRSTHGDRSASRNGRASGNRGASGNGCTGRNGHASGNWGASRDRSASGNRRNRCRTGHSSDRSASRRSRSTHRSARRSARDGRRTGKCRRTDFARSSLYARVAARYQRRGCRVRAQRYRGPEQPNAGNDFDVESVKGCHRRQLPHPHSGIPAITRCGQRRRAVPESCSTTCTIFSRPMFNMHHAAPHCGQIVTFDRRQPRVAATGSHRDRATQSATRWR